MDCRKYICRQCWQSLHTRHTVNKLSSKFRQTKKLAKCCNRVTSGGVNTEEKMATSPPKPLKVWSASAEDINQMKDLKRTKNTSSTKSHELIKKERVNDRISYLKSGQEEIEISVKESKRKLEHQYRDVTEQLSKAFSEELQTIDILGETQKMKLDNMASDLQTLSEDFIEGRGKKVSRQSMNSNLSNRSGTKLSNLLAENVWLKLKYKPPLPLDEENFLNFAQRRPLLSDEEDFRNFAQRHLLGYFVPLTDQEHLEINSFRSIEESHLGHTKSLSNSDLHLSSPRSDPSRLTKRMITADLISYTDVGEFKGSRLKSFCSAAFEENSMWICGFNRHVVNKRKMVLLNVEIPTYNVIIKKKKNMAKIPPALMCLMGNNILFANRGHKSIYSYEPSGQIVRNRNIGHDLGVGAMCSNDSHIFVFDTEKPGIIKTLGSDFSEKGQISTTLEDIRGCSVDTHFMAGFLSCSQSDLVDPDKSYCKDEDSNIVLSISSPKGIVGVVNRTQGVLWQLNHDTCPNLGPDFEPLQCYCFQNG